MTLNEKMKELRLSAGMTMKQVAKETHLSEASICRYEKGNRAIPLTYIFYWCEKDLFTVEELSAYCVGGIHIENV